MGLLDSAKDKFNEHQDDLKSLQEKMEERKNKQQDESQNSE